MCHSCPTRVREKSHDPLEDLRLQAQRMGCCGSLLSALYRLFSHPGETETWRSFAWGRQWEPDSLLREAGERGEPLGHYIPAEKQLLWREKPRTLPQQSPGWNPGPCLGYANLRLAFNLWSHKPNQGIRKGSFCKMWVQAAWRLDFSNYWKRGTKSSCVTSLAGSSKVKEIFRNSSSHKNSKQRLARGNWR